MNNAPLIRKLLAFLFLAFVIGTAAFFIHQRERAIRAELWDIATAHEALYYEPLANDRVKCFLCPIQCVLSPGEWGICKARKNIKGKLYSMVYGKIATEHVDPIEKKPFFHVLPGSTAFSIASTGCNMFCVFCQNWEISQCFHGDVPVTSATPEQVVDEALKTGSQSIAFTYNEPVINYEFMLETAKLAQAKGIKAIVVSNAFIEEKPLKELLLHIDAFKVDLKAFNEKFYAKFTGGNLEAIQNSLKIIKQSGVWLEIVTLLLPGENDSEEEIRDLSRWIKTNLGDDVPLHFSRFFPQYKLRNLPPTPPATLIRARKIAMEEGLKFVYTGNVAYLDGEATYCPESGEKVIERRGYFVTRDLLKDGACPDGEKIPGIWE